MQLTRASLFSLPVALLLASSSAWTAEPVSAPPTSGDLLGNVVVEAGAVRELPKIAILPSFASNVEDRTLHTVVRRDLELCGEFELLPDSAAPSGVYLPDTPIDPKAWASKGLEALVKVSARSLPNAQAELHAQAVLLTNQASQGGSPPAFDRVQRVKLSELRVEAHRMADALIGALTGQDGSFASHLTFSSRSGRIRQVFTIDADGNDPKAISPVDRVAILSTFGPGEKVFYVASRNHDTFAIYREGETKPEPQPVPGSVYGLAWSRDRSQVATAIANKGTIRVYTGPDLASARPVSTQTMALDPVFSPSGRLGYLGETKLGTRVVVDGAPSSPDGYDTSSPTFCNHPEGVRLVYAVEFGGQSDIFAAGERGGHMVRLTQDQGSNVAPACSPDGRLVAFFSTRKSGEGPGLYIMRTDGGHARRISNMLGDTLRWDPLPPPQR